MNDQRDNQKPKPPKTSEDQSVADEPTAGRAKTRRKDLSGVLVEIIMAKERNPANPYSYLTPQERAERLAKLWHEMFQRIDETGANPLDKQSP